MSDCTEAAERDGYVAGLLDGLGRHTWMRDGITYVGNGTYTLEQARDFLVQDNLIARAELDEAMGK